jgi:hypothetical protein
MYMAIPLQQPQQPFFLKQVEDIILTPQPFSDRGFAQRGSELRQVRQWSGSQPPVPIQVPSREWLPMKANYGFYLYNMETGYVDRGKNFPPTINRPTGFRCVGL